MKTIILLFLGFCLTLMGYAQDSKTVNVTAGQLSSAFTETELTAVTILTVTGTIDARDFKTMRDKIINLAELDISGVTIATYTGTEGTAGTSNTEYPANELPAYSFRIKKSLTLVTLPSSLISIGKFAFDSCSGITSISIPSSVISIGNAAFSDCTSLTSITIPSSVTTIGLSAFSYCRGLTSIIIPPSVTYIAASTFNNCSGLTSINIPLSVTNIDGSAFSYCTKLTSVDIPSNVTSIGYSAFEYCTSLVSLTIPSSVTSINSWAFESCTSLTSINIPSSVLTIGLSAFLNCKGPIIVAAYNPNYSSNDGLLFNKNQTSLIQCPISKTGSYTIPSTVTSIELGAFEKCAGLTSVIVPSSVTSLNMDVFANCTNLITVNIPSSVKKIGMSAFEYCTSLASVNIPSSVTSIDLGAFNGSSGFVTVDSNNPMYSSADGVLFDKTQTTLMHCPISKTGDYIIPSSVTSLESSAFNGCTQLTSVVIPSSVTFIEFNAFSNCSGLTSIYSEATSPVDLSDSYYVFYNVNKSTCTLYVPLGSKSAYQSADQWKDFENIEEITTGLTAKTITTIKLFPNPFTEGFWINGIDGSAKITLVDLNGKILLLKQVAENEYISLRSLPRGIYSVTIHTTKGITEKKMIKQ